MKYSRSELLKDIKEGQRLFLEVNNENERKKLKDTLDMLYGILKKEGSN